jgi:DNA polymerase-4
VEPPEGRWIIHLDLDAFFAAVEVLDNPALKGLPVIVGGLGPRSVVSTCSYEARAAKVRSGMPTARARRLCPDGVFLGVRMERYKGISQAVMSIFKRYTSLVEPLSLDEAFLDVTGSIASFGPAVRIARRIRAEVLEETGLTVSAGVASTKHVAKIASGLNKPDALTLIPPGTEREFLRTLDIGDLWGVGRVTAARLRSWGLSTIGDVADRPRAFLSSRLGEVGRRVWEMANGLDDREVRPDRPAKSLGAELTYPADIDGAGRIASEILRLCRRVGERMGGVGALTVTLKARDWSFKTTTRSKTFQKPFGGDPAFLAKVCLDIFPAGREGPWRLLGVSVSNLVEARRGDLLAQLRLEATGRGPAEGSGGPEGAEAAAEAPAGPGADLA